MKFKTSFENPNSKSNVDILANKLPDFSNNLFSVVVNNLIGKVDYIQNQNRESVEIEFFDTTLRDGDQSPGNAFTEAEKLYFAKRLSDAGFHFIEAGFPASHGDVTDKIAHQVDLQNSKLVGLARLHQEDISACKIALETLPDGQGVVHCFVATSPKHRELKLKGIDIEKIIENMNNFLGEIDQNKYKVMFSLEDATNTPDCDLRKVIEAAVRLGVDYINIPDTVGTAQPFEVERLIKKVMIYVLSAKRRAGIEKEIKVFYHGHNDLDNAVANTMAALRAGAHPQGTINGCGERAGNVSLFDIICNILARPELYGKYIINIDIGQLFGIIQEIDEKLGTKYSEEIQKRFLHTSGIHQAYIAQEVSKAIEDKKIKHKIMGGFIYKPDENGKYTQVKFSDIYLPLNGHAIGCEPKDYGIILSKHSGIKAVKAIFMLRGYEFCDDYQLEQVNKYIHKYAIKKLESDQGKISKRTIDDIDIITIAKKFKLKSVN